MATKLSPVGSQFLVNQFTTNSQDTPDLVPLADGRFVVVYETDADAGGNDVDIRGQFVNANGILSGGTIAVAIPGGIQEAPSVAARGDGGFTTVWEDFGTTTGVLMNPDIYYAVTNSIGNSAART